MPRGNVRTHTRRTASGGTTTVTQHARSTRGRKRRALVSPRHAWRMLRKAGQAMRRHKRGTALAFGALALGELAAWTLLNGVGAALATAGILALCVAYIAAMATGYRL